MIIFVQVRLVNLLSKLKSGKIITLLLFFELTNSLGAFAIFFMVKLRINFIRMSANEYNE